MMNNQRLSTCVLSNLQLFLSCSPGILLPAHAHKIPPCAVHSVPLRICPQRSPDSDHSLTWFNLQLNLIKSCRLYTFNNTSDTVRTHLQRCQTLGEGLLKLCAHQSPYTGCTHIHFPPLEAASMRPRFG